VGLRRLRDFTKATDAYIDDHFGLRDRLVHWNSRLRYRLGASSTPKVVIGSDGWLFYAGEKIIEQHTGEDVFTLIFPPQDSPTFHAASSATPNRGSSGSSAGRRRAQIGDQAAERKRAGGAGAAAQRGRAPERRRSSSGGSRS